MKKSLLIITCVLVLISVALGRVLDPAPKRLVFAEDDPLETEFFQATQLFDQDNLLPGDSLVGRYFTVTNTSVDTSYPLYFVAQKTGGDDRTPVDFSEVLNITVEKEGKVLVWNKTLKELFDKVDEGDGLDEDDGFSLETTLRPAESQKFFISVEFDETASNDFKSKGVIWNALLGFVGGAPKEEILSAKVDTTGTNLVLFVLGSLTVLTILSINLYRRRSSKED